MNKPQSILDFEKKYKIELKETKEKQKLLYYRSNYYLLNNEDEVIGLGLSRNRITEIPNLEDFYLLEILNLSYNQISKIEGLSILV